jgi:hypothetical protein
VGEREGETKEGSEKGRLKKRKCTRGSVRSQGKHTLAFGEHAKGV